MNLPENWFGKFFLKHLWLFSMPYTHVNNHIKNRQRRFYFWAKYWLVFLFCNAWLTHKQTIILADLNILKPVPSFTILLSKLVNLLFPIIFNWGLFESSVKLWGIFWCWTQLLKSVSGISIIKIFKTCQFL